MNVNDEEMQQIEETLKGIFNSKYDFNFFSLVDQNEKMYFNRDQIECIKVIKVND